jgi:hypothetical protein
MREADVGRPAIATPSAADRGATVRPSARLIADAELGARRTRAALAMSSVPLAIPAAVAIRRGQTIRQL